MTKVIPSFITIAALALLGGCAAQLPPTQVTRFHLGQPIARADIAILPRQPGEEAGLDYQAYAGAVGRALGSAGFNLVSDPKKSELIALISVDRNSRETGPARTPASIGIGLGGGSGGFGVGGSVNVPIGKPRARESIRTELFVQIKRRSEGSVIWEGRAYTEARSGSPLAAPAPRSNGWRRRSSRAFPANQDGLSPSNDDQHHQHLRQRQHHGPRHQRD